MICKACHTDNDGFRLYCSHCGKILDSSRHQCGFINHESDTYCGGCGKNLKSEVDVKNKIVEDTYGEKFSDAEIEELLREENINTKPKNAIMSQNEIDNFFKKS
jgi:hypothetical protein